MTAKEYALQQIRDSYNLPFLKIGMNVIVNQKKGKISGISNFGLKAKLTDENKTICFHPTWETAYLDEDGYIIQDFRNKQ